MRLWTILAVAAIAIGLTSTCPVPADARSGISPGRILGLMTAPLRHVLRGPRAHMRVHRHLRARQVVRLPVPRPEPAKAAVPAATTASAVAAGTMATDTAAQAKPANTETKAARAQTNATASMSPVAFWPHAATDIFGFAFEPNVAGEWFGARGAGTIAGGVFPASVRTAATATDEGDLCGSAASPDLAIGMTERIEFAVQPTGPQRDLLKPLRGAIANAIAEMTETCASVAAATAPERLDAMRERVGALKAAAVSVRMPLEQFYNSLTGEQKANLDAAADGARGSSFLRQCRQALADADWPARQIEQAVQPTTDQRASLERLRAAAIAMTRYLAPSCPEAAPTTVVARLDAAADWLDAMLYAVIAVGPELQNFYDALGDAQKERFNTMARRPVRGRT